MTTINKGSRRVGLFWWGLLLAMILVMVVLGVLPKREEQVAATDEKATPVTVLAIEPRSIRDEVVLPGWIQAQADVEVSAERAGRVVELLADKGAVVKADQPLLKLDDRLWQAALQRAEIQLKDARKDRQRWQDLNQSGAVSKNEFEEIQKTLALAENAATEARVIIEQCGTRSPIAGAVDDRLVDLGEYVNDGQPVFRIVDIDRVKLALDLPEQDRAGLAAGQALTFTVAALGGREFTGTVSHVALAADRQSNAFKAEVLVDNPDHLLKPGMIAAARVLRGALDGALVVPLAAIVPRKGQHVAYVVKDRRAIRCVVTIAGLRGTEAVLSGGLAAGDVLVIEGQRTLMDGALVDIKAP